MFMTKKKKVRQYLDAKPKEKYTAFDLLLIDYLDGSLENQLKSAGLKRINIQIQWDDEDQWILVNADYRVYEMDLTVYPDEILIWFDSKDELPEELEPEAVKEQSLPLESKEQLFDLLAEKIAGLD